MLSFKGFVFSMAILFASVAQAVVIETVSVGDAGNTGVTYPLGTHSSTAFGGVATNFEIGKYEVTNTQYAAFLNAVDPSAGNALSLYSTSMSSDFYKGFEHGGINKTLSNASGSRYVVKSGHGNRPVNFVNWYDAVRFTNWLHNGQGSGDTETGAYTLTSNKPYPTPTPYNGDNKPNQDDVTIVRNAGALWFLPTDNEWHKAAYYDPGKATGLVGDTGANDKYWIYPTQNNIKPAAQGPAGGSNSANYNNAVKKTTDVGAYLTSVSHYGTFDQGGNVFEWVESGSVSNATLDPGFKRHIRGGGWAGEGNTKSLSEANAAACQRGYAHLSETRDNGFRVATVPEPTGLLLISLSSLMMLGSRRRRVTAG